MGSDYEEVESFNSEPCTLSEFFEWLEGSLQFLTGLVDPKEFELTLEEIRIPLFVVGTPGIGKTGGIISTIDKINKLLDERGMSDKHLGFKKIQLGQKVVGALDGIPVVLDGEVKTMTIDELPHEEKDGKYGVLFLDELTTVDEQQMQPALGLADDSRSIGAYKLPENWLVVAAGNGPDCTNFIRADDAMLTRFQIFEIAYDYHSDWRPWAHDNGVDGDIIAFLNFKPELIARVESSDTDKAGKLAPNPRTWTQLNSALKARRGMRRGQNMSPEDIGKIASRFVGKNVAREFASFLRFKDTVKYDPAKIFKGTEKDPELMQKQEFHILLEACAKKMFKDDKEKNGKISESSIDQYVNYLKWLFKMDAFDTENVLNGIYELMGSVSETREVMSSPKFLERCPEFREFIRNHASLLKNNIDFLNKLHNINSN